MAKLFIFGIGGTGARVLRSFGMLMAAGVDIKADTVIPIIVDPDTQNADLNRTVEMLKSYKRLQGVAGHDSGFFKTDISKLADMDTRGEGRVKDAFTFDFGGINQSFKEFIHFNEMDPDTQALVQLLYTQDNLNSPLTIGFKGSPNVGSVVLNKLINSPELRFFADNFRKGDRIFIISSIFGGTGAAGFPLLIKNLRNPNSGLQNAGEISSAIIGAITVKPYFGLQTENESVIDSNAFITKTRDALAYYKNNLHGVNGLYYIADNPDTPYENRPGGASQRNDAHLVEVLAALSIIDFMDYQDADFGEETLFHEYGLRQDAPSITFEQLYEETLHRIGQQMVKFQLFAKYYKDMIREDAGKNYYKALNLDAAFANDSFHKELRHFLENKQWGYFAWLEELARNKRSFAPFNLSTQDLNLLVQGKPVSRSFFNKGITQDGFVVRLNKEERNLTSEANPNRKFLKMFNHVTEDFYTSKMPGI
ncbi:hypothetical protein [Cesiribacter andamanensis]|uniref:Uncharacterized protein n=1 Tax=Cesiribacter andamanensis AMV16 TaxID=1279009 RepID=M7NA21_9BACT|nr:hypothetical protein [Cesiribacter andamanensis]EMR04112.1 hypothetical protein ADICEAN_00735 [Cesiribacter andamanensis AMV16]